jgi:hypothetical protein
MNDIDNLPRVAASLLRAKPCPLDDTEPNSKQPKWNDTPLQSSIEAPSGPVLLVAQCVVTTSRAPDRRWGQRPANPRQCWLCEVRA